MDQIIISQSEPNWRAGFSFESAYDRFERKLTQAEALAHAINCNDFPSFNDVIQRNVLWLLGDLLTEARLALDEDQTVKS